MEKWQLLYSVLGSGVIYYIVCGGYTVDTADKSQQSIALCNIWERGV